MNMFKEVLEISSTNDLTIIYFGSGKPGMLSEVSCSIALFISVHTFMRFEPHKETACGKII